MRLRAHAANLLEAPAVPGEEDRGRGARPVGTRRAESSHLPSRVAGGGAHHPLSVQKQGVPPVVRERRRERHGEVPWSHVRHLALVRSAERRRQDVRPHRGERRERERRGRERRVTRRGHRAARRDLRADGERSDATSSRATFEKQQKRRLFQSFASSARRKRRRGEKTTRSRTTDTRGPSTRDDA